MLVYVEVSDPDIDIVSHSVSTSGTLSETSEAIHKQAGASGLKKL